MGVRFESGCCLFGVLFVVFMLLLCLLGYVSWGGIVSAF